MTYLEATISSYVTDHHHDFKLDIYILFLPIITISLCKSANPRAPTTQHSYPISTLLIYKIMCGMLVCQSAPCWGSSSLLFCSTFLLNNNWHWLVCRFTRMSLEKYFIKQKTGTKRS